MVLYSAISGIKYAGLLTESANNLKNTPSKNGLYLVLDNQLDCPTIYGILTSSATSNYTQQIFTRYDCSGVWIRASSETTWSLWKRVSLSDSWHFERANGEVQTYYEWRKGNTTLTVPPYSMWWAFLQPGYNYISPKAGVILTKDVSSGGSIIWENGVSTVGIKPDSGIGSDLYPGATAMGYSNTQTITLYPWCVFSGNHTSNTGYDFYVIYHTIM